MPADLIIASNRGPVSFTRTPTGFSSDRGLGGLVTAVTASLKHESAIWIATALSLDDRARAASGQPILDEPSAGIELKLLTFDEEILTGFYERASNQSLWFVAHGAEAAPAGSAAWDSYRLVNQSFADAISQSATSGATVLVQDYHLCLVPELLRRSRPDLKIAFFWHIAFPEPEVWQSLGENIARELLQGMESASVVGFHASRWTRRYERTRAAAGLEARAETATIPLGVDAAAFTALAASTEVAERLEQLSRFDDQLLIVRCDRIDPAKGVPDGLIAFGQLLDRRPDLVGRVTHLVRLTPSREGILEYDRERGRIERISAEINDRHAKPEWRAVELVIEDDLAASIAAYRRYDVLMVTSLADGMNLVAREAPLVNEHAGALILSRGAGAADAYEEGGAILVDPGDIDAISRALESALDMDIGSRRILSEQARSLAPGMAPSDWLTKQRQLAGG